MATGPTITPLSIPSIKMNDGYSIPQLGLGVYEVNQSDTVRSVKWALEFASAVSDDVFTSSSAGYRHIDTASVYGNESAVGQALRESAVNRSEIFVTTKVWMSEMGFDKAKRACVKSLQKLGLDYVDLYLVHSPQKNARTDTWRALVDLQKEGKVRSIGVSNYNVSHMEEILRTSDVKPAVNQIELLIRWGIQKGYVSIPKSVRRNRILENGDVFTWKLAQEDVEEMDSWDEYLVMDWDPTSQGQGQGHPAPVTDKFGLLGLLDVIRGTDPDQNALALGSDLTGLGLDLNSDGAKIGGYDVDIVRLAIKPCSMVVAFYPITLASSIALRPPLPYRPLWSTFVSPFAPIPTARPDPVFHLPPCYNLPTPPPPALSKIHDFSEETLFYAFYSCPRDALSESSAQELYSRNWRFHKEVRAWITRDTEAGNIAGNPVAGQAASRPPGIGVGGAAVDKGSYWVWDVAKWERERREMVVRFEDLEDRGGVGGQFGTQGIGIGLSLGLGPVGQVNGAGGPDVGSVAAMMRAGGANAGGGGAGVGVGLGMGGQQGQQGQGQQLPGQPSAGAAAALMQSFGMGIGGLGSGGGGGQQGVMQQVMMQQMQGGGGVDELGELVSTAERIPSTKDSLNERIKAPILNLLCPSPEEAINLFYKRFPELRRSPTLVNLERFSCTYGNKSPHMRGNLYITEQYLCFRARAFNIISKLVIPLGDITIVESMKSVRHLNALRIIDRTETTYIFSNFLLQDRERAYRAIMANCTHLSDLTETPISDSNRRSRSASEPFDQHTRFFSDSPTMTPLSLPRTIEPKDRRDSDVSMNGVETLTFPMSGPSVGGSVSLPRGVGGGVATTFPSKRECGCTDHALVLKEQDFAVDPRTIFLSIFGEDERQCQPWLTASRGIGSEDLVPERWGRRAPTPDSSGIGEESEKVQGEEDIWNWTTRTLNYFVKVPMISRSPCHETQTIAKCEEGLIIVNTSVQTPKVPYGDTFSIEGRVCISSLGDGKSRLLLTVRVDVKKQTWMTGQITRGVHEGQKDYAKRLTSELENLFRKRAGAQRVETIGDELGGTGGTRKRTRTDALPSNLGDADGTPAKALPSGRPDWLVQELIPLQWIASPPSDSLLRVLAATALFMVILVAAKYLIGGPTVRSTCDGNCQLARVLEDMTRNFASGKRVEEEMAEIRSIVGGIKKRLIDLGLQAQT
ncbi:hypothetical protein HDU93_007022 [Gonapodya sp. JEL0774]|nr:hypothetical protein HDU93_007022 [Gonapodya sp. JEL0774]